MGSTARTPVSLPIFASSAGVIPAGTAAIRSGTNSCRGGDPAEPGVCKDLGTEAGRAEETAEAPPVRAEAAATPTGGETVKGKGLTGGWPATEVTAALLAGTASPVRVTL